MYDIYLRVGMGIIKIFRVLLLLLILLIDPVLDGTLIGSFCYFFKRKETKQIKNISNVALCLCSRRLQLRAA